MNSSDKNKLNSNLNNIIFIISNNITEIYDLLITAKEEYKNYDNEFGNLKKEVNKINDTIKIYEDKLSNSNCIKEVRDTNYYLDKKYQDLDLLKVKLAIEKEKEILLIQRRNELEHNLKTVSNIINKSEKLEKDFKVAIDLLSGNIGNMCNNYKNSNTDDYYGLSILETQENERKRIAREMHDGPAQLLTNLIHKTELCIKILEVDPIRTRLELQSFKNVIRTTIDDIRRIIYNLRPMSIDDLGLVPTLERYFDKLNDDLYLNISFNILNEEYQVKPIINLTLFRIVQEALNNIYKYAESTLVDVLLKYNKNDIELTIRDNGIGFDINEVMNKKRDNYGLGLSMMKERVFLLSGHIDIISEINKGTTYYVKVPL